MATVLNARVNDFPITVEILTLVTPSLAIFWTTSRPWASIVMQTITRVRSPLVKSDWVNLPRGMTVQPIL